MSHRLTWRILLVTAIMITIIFLVNLYFLGVISNVPVQAISTQAPPPKDLPAVLAGIKYALTPRRHVSLDTSWDTAKSWVSQGGLYTLNDNLMGNILHAMRTARILRAENANRGTQLKLLFILEGKQKVFFKPKWYDREHLIRGSIYSGKDRHNAEVVAFYLSLLLDMRWVPLAVLRSINAKTEMLDVASGLLKETIITNSNDTLCVYGKCHYCRKNETVCANEDGRIEGSVILLIDDKLTKYRSSWQRTYNVNKKAEWEVNPNYCSKVKNTTSLTRLLDFVDTSIFDFLMQNGDRHHYETVMDRIVLLDNGKSLGNPHKDVLDILAPLYQCCIIRKKTWDRLLLLSEGSLKESLRELLKHEPGEEPLTEWHLEAIERRLGTVLKTVENCISQRGKTIFKHR